MRRGMGPMQGGPHPRFVCEIGPLGGPWQPPPANGGTGVTLALAVAQPHVSYCLL